MQKSTIIIWKERHIQYVIDDRVLEIKNGFVQFVRKFCYKRIKYI